MKIVEGNLSLLGNATIQRHITQYTVIEIGDTVLQRVRVPTSLDNFLSRALKQSGNTKLFLNGKVLCGIQTPEGKLYCYRAKPIAALILCAAGIPLIPFFGLGLLFLWQGIGEFKNYSIANKLRGMGATAIEL